MVFCRFLALLDFRRLWETLLAVWTNRFVVYLNLFFIGIVARLFSAYLQYCNFPNDMHLANWNRWAVGLSKYRHVLKIKFISRLSIDLIGLLFSRTTIVFLLYFFESIHRVYGKRQQRTHWPCHTEATLIVVTDVKKNWCGIWWRQSRDDGDLFIPTVWNLKTVVFQLSHLVTWRATLMAWNPFTCQSDQQLCNHRIIFIWWWWCC